MNYTIDTTPFSDYGLYVSDHKGHVHLPEAKQQFYTVYKKEGYQYTNRNGNVLEISAFVIASDTADFTSKLATLRTLFSATGLRVLDFGNGQINCFAKDGFQVDNVKATLGAVYARFKIKLVIV